MPALSMPSTLPLAVSALKNTCPPGAAARPAGAAGGGGAG
jgi:hypothetical protein